MIPIYNRNTDLIAWTDMKNVYDVNMQWIAFIYNGNCFNASTCEWIGPVNGTNFLDNYGRVIGWSKECPVKGLGYSPVRPIRPIRPITPIRPIRPVTPIKPIRPITPMGGWSNKEKIV